MPSFSIQQAVEIGLGFHRTGQLYKAEEIYREILKADPTHPIIRHYLGLLFCHTNRVDEGLRLMEETASRHAGSAEFHNNLGHTLRRLGRLNEAESRFQAALALQPQSPEAWTNLGITLAAGGKLAEAAHAIEQAIVYRPTFGEAYHHLGTIERQGGHPQNAVSHFRRAIELGVATGALYNDLGDTLKILGQRNDAVACFEKALLLQPDFTPAKENLAKILEHVDDEGEANPRETAASDLNPDTLTRQAEELLRLGQTTRAISFYAQAVALNPNDASLHNGLGQAWLAETCLKEAADSFHQALALDAKSERALIGLAGIAEIEDRYPDALHFLDRVIQHNGNDANLWNRRGVVFLQMGSLREATDCFRRAIDIYPSFSEAHSHWIAAGLYSDADNLPERYAEHLGWAATHAEPLTGQACARPGQPHERLRIGYVSPDFRNHAVATFIEPVLAAHDGSSLEVICYSDVARPDHVTARLRRYAALWRDTVQLSDQDLCEQVRRDQVDILVDLCGHYPHNRLKMFARKPAPVQVSYLGYQYTTGMSAMNYRLTDAYLDPPVSGVTQYPFYSESLIRLSRFACYVPPPEAGAVGPCPALKKGYVTLGSFGRLSKQTQNTLAIWAEIMRRADGTRLLQVARGLDDPAFAEHVLARFEKAGIPRERVDLVTFLDFPEYLALHHQVDLMLDTFPFNGHTTTCHALWMGVPTLTYPGKSYTSRMSANVMRQGGCSDFVAGDATALVELATTLAREKEKIALVRSELREKMKPRSYVMRRDSRENWSACL